MEKLTIIKIGGNVLDDSDKLDAFLVSFALLKGHKILVHGGGKIASDLGKKLGIQSNYVDGRRITDADTIDLVTMVYGGLINKKLVAGLQKLSCNAIGLCGADAAAIPAQRRKIKEVDFGFVGDPDTSRINTQLINTLLESGTVPVFAPLTFDLEGNILNTNADTIATELAKALGGIYEVNLVFCFEKNGLLADPSKEDSVIRRISEDEYKRMKESSQIYGGMLPKLENAFAARQNRVSSVVIGHSDMLEQLVSGNSGTQIV